MYYIASLAKFGNCCRMVYGLVGKGNGRARTLVFPFLRRLQKVMCCFKMYFRRDFLSPHPTKVLGMENYLSASMSCCSDDLAQLLLCLDL